MLSATKITCLILGIMFLVAGILGKLLSGDIIGILLVATAVIIDKRQVSQPQVAKTIASIFIVLLGLFAFGVIQFVGALSNLDTTGATPASTTMAAVVVAGIIIVGGLFFINRPKAK